MYEVVSVGATVPLLECNPLYYNHFFDLSWSSSDKNFLSEKKIHYKYCPPLCFDRKFLPDDGQERSKHIVSNSKSKWLYSNGVICVPTKTAWCIYRKIMLQIITGCQHFRLIVYLYSRYRKAVSRLWVAPSISFEALCLCSCAQWQYNETFSFSD
jgi:hypothetical protein